VVNVTGVPAQIVVAVDEMEILTAATGNSVIVENVESPFPQQLVP